MLLSITYRVSTMAALACSLLCVAPSLALAGTITVPTITHDAGQTVKLTWTDTLANTAYAQWKLQSASSWTSMPQFTGPVGTRTYLIPGLDAGIYQFKACTVWFGITTCSAPTSAYKLTINSIDTVYNDMILDPDTAPAVPVWVKAPGGVLPATAYQLTNPSAPTTAPTDKVNNVAVAGITFCQHNRVATTQTDLNLAWCPINDTWTDDMQGHINVPNSHAINDWIIPHQANQALGGLVVKDRANESYKQGWLSTVDANGVVSETAGPDLTRLDGTTRTWGTFVGWTWVNPGRNNKAKNTAVQVRNAEVYVLLDPTAPQNANQWVQLKAPESSTMTGYPGAPTNLTTEVVNGVLRLKWDRHETTATDFQVHVVPRSVYDQPDRGASAVTTGIDVLDPAAPWTGMNPPTFVAFNTLNNGTALSPGVYDIYVNALYDHHVAASVSNTYRVNANGTVETLRDNTRASPWGAEEDGTMFCATATKNSLAIPCAAGVTPKSPLINAYGGVGQKLVDANTVQIGPVHNPYNIADGNNQQVKIYELWNPCGFCTHSDNPTYPDVAGHVLAYFVTSQARLVLIDPNGTDDRALAEFFVQQGVDAYQLGNYDYKGRPYMTRLTQLSAGQGRFKKVTSEWQAFNVANLTNNDETGATGSGATRVCPKLRPDVSGAYPNSAASAASPTGEAYERIPAYCANTAADPRSSYMLTKAAFVASNPPIK